MEIAFPWKSYVKFILNADFLPGIEELPEVKYKRNRGVGVAFTVVPAQIPVSCVFGCAR